MEGERKGVWEGGGAREGEEEDNERVKGWEIEKEHCFRTHHIIHNTGKTAKRYSWLRKQLSHTTTQFLVLYHSHMCYV